MKTMYLLCIVGDDPFDWSALSVGSNASEMQQEADRMDSADYEREHEEWLARGQTGPCPMPLDDPRRQGYRKYFVREVAVWPEIQGRE